MNAPTVTRKRLWNVYRIHAMCIKYGLYTYGSNAEFEKMLEYVRTNEPTDEAMAHVAIDIQRNSAYDAGRLEDFLSLIEREVIITTFKVEE